MQFTKVVVDFGFCDRQLRTAALCMDGARLFKALACSGGCVKLW
jgi:threonine aldolase